jgi:hypothetical protein
MSRHIRPLGSFGPIYWGLVIGAVVQLFSIHGVLTGIAVWLILTVIQMIVNVAKLLESVD